MATTVTVKGQVTIPKAVRDAVGIKPGDRVEVRASEQGGVSVFPVKGTAETERMTEVDRRLAWAADYAAKHRIDDGLTTDEVMHLLRGED